MRSSNLVNFFLSFNTRLSIPSLSSKSFFSSFFPLLSSSLSLTWWSGLSISRAINHDFLTNNGGVSLLDRTATTACCASSLQRLNAISLLTPQRVICAITRPKKMLHRQKKNCHWKLSKFDFDLSLKYATYQPKFKNGKCNENTILETARRAHWCMHKRVVYWMGGFCRTSTQID